MRADKTPEPKSARASASRRAVRPRARRTTAEIDNLIVESARRLFSEKGYWGTSTREVADRAGVAEILLFRHFGSKPELYSASVVLPIVEFIEHWTEEWINYDWQWEASDVEKVEYNFISSLYRFVIDHRGLVASYLAMSVFDPDLISGSEHSARLQRALDRLADYGTQTMLKKRMGAGANLAIIIRATLAMTLTMAMLHDFADPEGRFFSPEEVVAEMTQLILHGTLNRSTDTDP